jgi:hypothetical protein
VGLAKYEEKKVNRKYNKATMAFSGRLMERG